MVYFLFLSDSGDECAYAFQPFITITKLMGVPLAEHKTVALTKNIEFLGVQTDFPEYRLHNYLSEVSNLLFQKNTPISKFKSVIGKLSFAKCVCQLEHVSFVGCMTRPVTKLLFHFQSYYHRKHIGRPEGVGRFFNSLQREIILRPLSTPVLRQTQVPLRQIFRRI